MSAHSSSDISSSVLLTGALPRLVDTYTNVCHLQSDNATGAEYGGQ